MKKITAFVLSFIILTGLLVPVYAADENNYRKRNWNLAPKGAGLC